MPYLSRASAAEFLANLGYPVAKTTLQKYATVGGGPKYRRFGNRALYQERDLLAWAEAKLSPPRSNSSDEEAA